MQYIVEQRVSTWIKTTVEAETLEQAIELADQRFSDGEYTENYESFELMDHYYITDTDGNETEKAGS